MDNLWITTDFRSLFHDVEHSTHTYPQVIHKLSTGKKEQKNRWQMIQSCCRLLATAV